MITQYKVRALFNYRSSGKLIRRVKTSNRTKVGEEAGGLHERGYRRVSIDGTRFRLHRLIFLWHHGYLPEYIDHKDGDTTNNRIENLRECSSAQNQWNARIGKNNTSGVKGVCWHKSYNKWMATLGVNGKTVFIGYFEFINEAERAIIKERRRLHGEFANDGLNAAIDNLK